MESVINEFRSHAFYIFHQKPFLVAVVLLVLSILHYIIKTKGILPGPIGVPFLGYLPFLDNSHTHVKLKKLQKKFGDIFSFNYAGTLYINLGSIKAMRELQVNKADYFERVSEFTIFLDVFRDGVGFINGDGWKTLRKFFVQQFRELGMTSIKTNVSGSMYDNIKETIQFLRSKKGEPVDIQQMLTDKCNAVLRHTMFGDIGITEQEVREINESYGGCLSFMTIRTMLIAGNLAKYIVFPLTSGYGAMKKHHRNIERILSEIVNRHKSNFDDEHPRDIIDAFFKERNKRKSKGDPTAQYFTDRALVCTLLQFIGDGVLSLSIIVSSSLKYAVDHKEEQEKIYSELMDVVGPDRDPTMEDKSNLPYTNAFIQEILRTSETFSLFPSQQCIEETTVNGYRIPKGAITLLNFYACHSDPDVYEEPEKFNPLRFISEGGKLRSELPVTFGIGKRACIGEGFTMAQVFLFLSTIIKNFELSLLDSSKEHTFEDLISGQMKFIAKPRK